MCNTKSLSFNIAQTAGYYSALAAVLAGFAFVAITVVLAGDHLGQSDASSARVNSPDSGSATDDQRDAESASSRVLVPMVAAFMALILATVEYAILAGDKGCALVQGRSAAVELLGGTAFALAIYLLLYAIVQLISVSGLDRAAVHVGFVVAVIAPPLVTLFLILGLQDVAYVPWEEQGEVLQPHHGALARRTETISWIVPLAILVCLIAAWLVGRYRAAPKWATSPFAHDYLPYVPLFLSVAAVARSIFLSSSRPNDRIGGREAVAWLVVGVAVLLAQALLLALQRKVVAPPPRWLMRVRHKLKAPPEHPAVAKGAADTAQIIALPSINAAEASSPFST